MNFFDQFDAKPEASGGGAGGNYFDRFEPGYEEPGDFGRGLKTAFQQLPQLAYGLAALGAATLESAVGEGGMATAAKQWAVKGFESWGEKIQQSAKETDDLDVAWEGAKNGDYGGLVDWLQHGLGYTVGQGVQMLGTGGIGYAAGRLALRGVAEKVAGGMVAKEAAEMAATEAGKTMAQDILRRSAVANVAGRLGQWGAVGASAYGMEGGEIGGELAAQSVHEGRELSGAELAKAFAATTLAGSLEFAADALALKTLTGTSFGFKGTPGVKGKAARALAAAGWNMPAEGATEYLQTGLEEYGKGKETAMLPFEQSAQSQRHAFNAAALGALGGAVHGVVGGAVSSPEQAAARVLKAPSIDSAIDTAIREASFDGAPGGLVQGAIDFGPAQEAAMAGFQSEVGEEMPGGVAPGAVDFRSAEDAAAREAGYEQMEMQRQQNAAAAATRAAEANQQFTAEEMLAGEEARAERDAEIGGLINVAMQQKATPLTKVEGAGTMSVAMQRARLPGESQKAYRARIASLDQGATDVQDTSTAQSSLVPSGTGVGEPSSQAGSAIESVAAPTAAVSGQADPNENSGGGTQGTDQYGDAAVLEPDRGPTTPVVAGLPTPKQRLFVERGGERFEVDSLEEASQKWNSYRDTAIQQGGRPDTAGGGARIVDQNGTEVARISWNGKVWPPGEYKEGQRPLVGKTFAEEQAERAKTIDAEAHQAAPSPQNALPEPSEAQKEAGNYRKGHVRISGADVSIENPAGSKRNPDWPDLQDHYGYQRGTIGFDKDHLDVFVKPGTPENWAGTVYVVNQTKANGHFDEHKAVFGAASAKEGEEIYRRNYEKGWDRFSSIVPMPFGSYMRWAVDKSKTGPKGGAVKPVLILGRTLDKLTRKELEVSARKAKTLTQREAAQAEIDRRDDEIANRPISEAEIKRREEASVRWKAKAAERKSIQAGDSITQAIIKLGGLRSDLRKEVSGDVKNIGIPGVGHLFTKRGRNLDEMASLLQEAGYLTQGDIDASTDTGGTRLLVDRIDAELKGNKKFYANVSEDEQYAAERARRDEIDQQVAEQQNAVTEELDALSEDEQGEAFEAADVIISQGALSDAELDAILGADARPSPESQEGGAQPGATAPSQAGQEEVPAAEVTSAEREPGSDDEIPATSSALTSGMPPEQGVERPALDLTQQTESELKARADAEAAAAKKKTDEENAAEAKRKADAERGDFALTGSARAADANPNQADIFGAQPAPLNPIAQAADALIQAANAMKTAVAAPTQPAKIADVGENLWANRRNFTRGAIAWDNVKDLNDALKVKEVVKAKVWPKPDYEKLVEQGMEPFFARMLKQVYDGIATAPTGKSDEDLKRYINVVGRIREAVFDWAKDNNANRAFLEQLAARAKSMSGRRIALMEMVSDQGSIRDVILDRVWPETKGKSSGKFYGTDAGKDLRAIGGNRALKHLQFTMDDAVDAMKDIEKGWPTPQEAWQRQGYEVVKGEGITAQFYEGRSTRDDAPYVSITWNMEGRRREILHNVVHGAAGDTELSKNDAVVQQVAQGEIDRLTGKYLLLDKRGQVVKVNDTEEQAKDAARELVKRESKGGEIRGMNIEAAERTGPARRPEGENVTSERLMQEFGFRGVNFGREGWINQNERQAYLNHAYDALQDLSEILDIPPKALSLNGMLGIAFGAQGRGGNAAAHFVPGHNEINLTKTMGAGTLAHEWGHALDHYFATQAGMAKSAEPYLSAAYGKSGGEIRPEITEAFKSVVRAMKSRPMTEAEVNAQEEMSKKRAMRDLETWLQHFRKDIERAAPEKLSEFDKLAERMRKGDRGDGYVKVGQQTLSEPVALVKALVKGIKGASTNIASNWKGLESNASFVAYKLEQKEATKEHVPQTTASAYAGESYRKDQGKGGKAYWSTPWEMFARAFESWVSDQLAERAQSNTFLSDAVLRAEMKDRSGEGYAMPYPRGEDRQRINQAIGKLVDAIETRETDKGVAMFSRAGTVIGMDRRLVQAVVDRVTAKWKNAPGIEVVESLEDPAVPAAVRNKDEEQRRSGATGTPRGVFYNGKVYLFADAIGSVRAIVETLFHETLGHHGLRGAFGDRLDTVLDLVASAQRSRVEAKARQYGLDVADIEQRRTAAEEVLAEIAEARPESGIVKRAIAAIRQFLRDIGIDVEFSENDIIEQFILPARSFVEQGREEQRQQLAPAFARSGKENLKRLELAKRRIEELVSMFEKGSLKDDTDTHIGETPWALQLLGAPARNLYVGGAMLNKVLKGKHGHQITPDMVRQLAEQLLEPLFVFASEDPAMRAMGALVVATEITDRTGKPIVVPIHVDVNKGRVVANEIASIYGREEGVRQLESWANQGLLRYYDKSKTANPSTTLRLSPEDLGRLPHVVQLGLAANPNVRSDEDVVNERGAMFSRAPAIAASATTGDHRDFTAARVAEFVRNLLHNDKRFNFWHRTIGTQQHKALINREFRPVYDESQACLSDVSKYANESADLARELLPRVESFKDFAKQSPSKDDIEKVSGALMEGTLFGGGSPLDGRVWTDEELRSGRALERMGGGQLPIFKPLNEKQIALYRQTLESVGKSLGELGKSIVHRLVRAFDIGFDREMSLEDVAQSVREQADDRITDASIDLELLNDENYIKDLLADVYEAAGEGRRGEEAVGRELARIDRDKVKLEQQIEELEGLKKSIDDIEAKTNALKDHGYFPAMRFGQFALHVVEPNEDGTVEQLFFGLYESQTAANLAARQLEKEMRAEHPDMEIQRGMISKEQHRLFQGLSLDALETFAEYLTDDTGTPIAKDPLVQGFLKAAVSERSALKRHIHRKGITGYSDDVPRVLANFTVSTARAVAMNYHGAEMLRLANDIRAGDVKDEAIKLVNYLRDPQEEAQAIRGFLFTQFLGGSIAHGIVNMTQPFMVTVPYLSQYTSAADAAAKVSKAATTKTRGLNGAIKDAYERAKKEGVVAPQEIHQLRAETGGLPIAKSLALRKLSFLWGSIYSITEQFNRTTTFLAAYRIATDKGMADPYGFAKQAVDETQFVYNKGNRPNWARGPVGATVFTFKQFSIAYLELAKRLYAKDKKAFALMGMMLLAAAGLEGLPFAEDLEDLIDTIGQWMGFATNSKKKLRRWATDILGKDLAQVALHGVSGLPWMPVDVSVRMGLQNLIPGTSMLKPSEKNKARDVLELVGPIGQFVPTEDTMLGKALDRIAKSDYLGAVKAGAPVAVQNVAKGAEMLDRGYATDAKGKKIIEVSSGEAVLKMAGLQPASVARESRKIGEIAQDIDLQKRVESEIAEQWARGRVDDKPGDVRDAQKKLHDWNRDNPELKIRVTMEQIRRRMKELRMPREQRFVKSAPPEIRSGVREALRQ